VPLGKNGVSFPQLTLSSILGQNWLHLAAPKSEYHAEYHLTYYARARAFGLHQGLSFVSRVIEVAVKDEISSHCKHFMAKSKSHSTIKVPILLKAHTVSEATASTNTSSSLSSDSERELM